MEFIRKDYAKYNTTSFIIKNAVFSLKDCEILEVKDTQHDYQKAVVKISKKMVDKMNDIEKDINDYLSDEGIDKITLVYGNKIYAKKETTIPKEDLDCIKIKSVFVNNERKPFLQLWLV